MIYDPHEVSNRIIVERHQPVVEDIEQEMRTVQEFSPVELLAEWVNDRPGALIRAREHHRRMIRLHSRAARALDEALEALPLES